MKPEGKLKAIIKITCSERMDKCVGGKNPRSFSTRNPPMGSMNRRRDLSGQSAGSTRRSLRTPSVAGTAAWARMLHRENW